MADYDPYEYYCYVCEQKGYYCNCICNRCGVQGKHHGPPFKNPASCRFEYEPGVCFAYVNRKSKKREDKRKAEEQDYARRKAEWLQIGWD